MGQKMSLRNSEDTLSLFPPLSHSTNSLTNDCTLDDLVNNNYQDHKTYKNCRKISKIKKSLSECFRSKFHRLEESDDNDGEIMNVHRSKSEQTEIVENESRSSEGKESGSKTDQSRSLVSETWASQELPKDLHEVHNQLATLMSLLSQTDVSTRDVSSQTMETDMKRDSLILDQHEKLRHLHLENDSQSRTIEKYAREIAILKTQLTRQRLETKNHDHLITFLKGIKERKVLHSTDYARIDEVIEHLINSSQSTKCQPEKTNVAVINPCSSVREESCILFNTNISHSQPEDTVLLCNRSDSHSKESQETKLICFLDHSVTPYISTIPLTPSQITLSHVKHYTRSVLPKNVTCRFIFKSMIPGSPNIQEEISRDSDFVPVQDNKIIVRIRM